MQHAPAAALTATFGLALSLAVGTAANALTETETFDTVPSDWVLTSNSGSFPGFSNTNNTGGASGSGEAGGLFPAAWGHYADNTVGNITFDDDLTITGELAVTNGIASDPFLQFGYHNASNPDASNIGAANDFLGFRLTDQSSTQWRFSVIYNTSSDTTTGSTNTGNLVVVDPGQYTFEFTYDADGDPANSDNGLITLDLIDSSNNIVGTSIKVIPDSKQDQGLNANAMGWRKVNGAAAEAYVDHLEYTVVPEPGALALLGMGGVLMTIRRHRKG